MDELGVIHDWDGDPVAPAPRGIVDNGTRTPNRISPAVRDVWGSMLFEDEGDRAIRCAASLDQAEVEREPVGGVGPERRPGRNDRIRQGFLDGSIRPDGRGQVRDGQDRCGQGGHGPADRDRDHPGDASHALTSLDLTPMLPVQTVSGQGG
jgi:hypothetical protein